jgi:hypothetical protein
MASRAVAAVKQVKVRRKADARYLRKKATNPRGEIPLYPECLK